MKNAAVFLAPGFEECEALITIDLLRRAGIETFIVSVHNTDEITGSHNITVKADKMINDVQNELFDCIVMPGGMPGTAHLMESKAITELTMTHYENGKLLAAICAAPSVFGVLHLLENRKATCFPGFENNLKNAVVLSEKAVKDGNIITAKGLGAAFEFSHAIITALLDKESADQLLASIQY